ncbi:MAG: class I SAM-dependent methyltransferase [Myxococcales bacterium]|nr:class I SAM-dependent methyltransferase [Myxococcales bacterium]
MSALELRAPFYACCPVCQATGASPVVSFPQLVFVRCRGCGVIFKSEQVPGLGGAYEEEYFRFNRAKYLSRWAHRVRKCMRQLLVCLEVAPHARDVLDVGCSAGYVLEAARRLGLEPVGVDLSRFAVSLCRERGFAAEEGRLEKLPFPDASFDVVTCKHTLEHIERPLEGLAELRRVLRPGGVAFLIVPDAAYYKLAVMPKRGRSFRPDRRGWQHHVYYFENNLADAATRAGLEPVRAGKDIYRRRLAKGLRWPWEGLRYLFLLAWVWVCRVTRLRRELQLIARRPTVK